MKKSHLRNIIRESIKELLNEQGMPNPFSNPPPGAGTGPNWATAEAAWDNWANSGGANSAPPPPQPFLNSMANLGCPGKQSRMNVLSSKWSSLFTPGPGQMIAPNNPLWQSQLASKLIWLSNDLQNNC
tara:strand:- start:55 stop:438 length:384 start_codon:yes stop_codon:yes gene_type:complete